MKLLVNKGWKLFACSVFFSLSSLAQAPALNIIPQPASLQQKEGVFVIDNSVSVNYAAGNKALQRLAAYFSDHVRRISAYRLPFNQKRPKAVLLQVNNTVRGGEEAYRLTVTPSSITVAAATPKGIFYGLQSLLQTLPAVRTNEALLVPCMEISDAPRFGWRGFTLDVSRHFYPVEAIKEIIDLLALYKLNVFHWHLTDNEGWRMEIKKYPKLTSVGAWRTEIPGSVFYKKDTLVPTGPSYRYGGYYTQEQVKDVVAYAAARNITVIPEIEMPGHSGAALAAYPQFSCFRHPQPVPNSSFWNGRTDSALMAVNYCAGNDSSFLFLQTILDEVLAIFPSPYIHVGGDEVDKSYWKRCPRCQRRIKEEGLKNEEELQSYFIRRMENYLLAHNRKLLGWDEILEGGLAPSATVMSWRGEKGGIAAAQMGHPVVMTPSNPLYFNRYQAGPEGEPLAAKFSINTLEKVYAYNPQPDVLSAAEKRSVLGAGAALWTEFISSVSHVEYMLLPRLPALAEALWTPLAEKDFTGFVRRLNGWHFNAWQQWGLRFHTQHFTSQTHEESRR